MAFKILSSRVFILAANVMSQGLLAITVSVKNNDADASIEVAVILDTLFASGFS